MFAMTQMTGMDFAFPDVCKTLVGVAVVPIPYPNIALRTTAIPNVTNIFTECMPDHNLMTTTPVTNGDQAGLLLGIISSLIMGPSKNLFGSVKVFKDVMPATMMLCPTGQNGEMPNAPGVSLLSGQFKILIMS